MYKHLLNITLLVVIFVLAKCQGPSQLSLTNTNEMKLSELSKDISKSITLIVLAQPQDNFHLSRIRDIDVEEKAKIYNNIQTTKQMKQQRINSNNRLLVDSEVQKIIDSSSRNNFNNGGQAYPIESQIVLKGRKTCIYERMDVRFSRSDYFNFELTSDNIFPGSVLMSNSLKGAVDGTGTNKPIPSVFLQNPTIQIYSWQNNKTLNYTYDGKRINEAISQSIASNLEKKTQDNQIKIHAQIFTSDDFLLQFQVNKKLLTKLGLYNPILPLQKFQKKIIICLSKQVAQFTTVLKSYEPNLPDTPLNTFFSPSLTLSEFNSHPDWWSVQNPPVYIDSVIYGSRMFLTVDYDQAIQKLYQSLKSQQKNGPTKTKPIIDKILSHPSLFKFMIGAFSNFELEAFKNSSLKQNYQNFVSSFYVPSQISNMLAIPIFYQIKDFSGKLFSTDNKYQFIRVRNCTSLPKTFKVLITAFKDAPLSFIVEKLSGETLLKMDTYSPMIFDLTPYLSEQKTNVVLKYMTNAADQGSVGFIVDDAYTEKLKIKCSGNCIGKDAALFTINKETGEITP